MTVFQQSLFGEHKEVVDPHAIAREFLLATKGIGTPSITSVSGGRTSAWMAINYPTDYYIFALVRTNDPGHAPTDPGLLAAIRQKCPDFVASMELPDTLRCVLELEQKLGREIHWVWAGATFEGRVAKKRTIPNQLIRFCTVDLKITPIFDWVQSHWPQTFVEMNLGFRADEPNRVFRMCGGKYTKSGGWDFTNRGQCERDPRNSSKRIEWRFRQAPLFLDGVEKHHIYNDPWIQRQPFPEVSNCSFCFFHTPTQHRIQYAQNPQCLKVWADMETSIGKTFLKDMPISELAKGRDMEGELFAEEIGCTECTD